MGKNFLDDDFLLECDTASALYHDYASKMPIFDYHNHLSPKDIDENRKFKNITEAWLEGDHYKWRAMRINGIAEKFCTGDASPKQKFLAWAKTVPYTLRNPLFHWTHLELKNYFDVRDLLNERSADDVYERCNSKLQLEDFRVQPLLAKMNVKVVCTTDDPCDDLSHHLQYSRQSGSVMMFPSFRPDKALIADNIDTYNKYIDLLSAVCHKPIDSMDDLLQTLNDRAIYFKTLGCRSADHGLEFLYFDKDALTKAPLLFKKARERKLLTPEENLQLRSGILIHLCKMYHALGWVQQFHLGALRNNNTRLSKMIGADSGFDSIGEFPQALHMSRFFDHLDETDQLSKTIIYNSNPTHNEVFASMVGNFNDGSVAGKIQFGTGWWFLDQKDGMEKQLNALSNMSLLSRFVGMVTDSRSFLSFSRHEYFRRILCNLVGKEAERGELPNDLPFLGKMIQDVCYYNTKNYFFPL
ncbi:MAG TPA: glucuronate isomerase [Cyclobacteriaceae bacterium]|jgi:glucuronate isomerase|nr:glucuronate isomerase [Cyclobacteriaceae bacterium]